MLTPARPHKCVRAARLTGLCLIGALVGLAAAYVRFPTPPADPSAAVERAGPAATPGTLGCLGAQTAALVWPRLSEIQPRPAAAGSGVTVIASGGYAKCGASGVDESGRSFRLDLDGTAAGSLLCYINHCEGQITLPAGLAAGTHLVTAEGGSQLSLEVTKH